MAGGESFELSVQVILTQELKGWSMAAAAKTICLGCRSGRPLAAISLNGNIVFSGATYPFTKLTRADKFEVKIKSLLSVNSESLFQDPG